MEFSAKHLLLLALIFATSVLRLEGRDIKSKPENYKPQNFFSYGGFYGSPMGPQLGFGAPGFGTIPIIGNAPFPGTGGVVGGGGRSTVKP